MPYIVFSVMVAVLFAVARGVAVAADAASSPTEAASWHVLSHQFII